jgi:hypothetical protein
MTTIQIILLLSAIALIIGVILASGGSGPRITQITRTVKRDEDKDGDNA